jgi:predicted nucleotidyltransferase
MVKGIDSEVINNIEAFIEEVKKHYKVDFVILFGSFAKGSNREDSDIDIAIVSSDVKNRFTDGVKMASLRWDIDLRIEVHPINTTDFKNIETPFVDEIKKTGIQIYAA